MKFSQNPFLVDDTIIYESWVETTQEELS